MYRVYYDEGFKIFLMCSNQRPAYNDEVPVLVTPSLKVARKVIMDLQNEQKRKLRS